MFLEPIRIARPDLRDEVRALIRVVCDAPAGQTLPLTELVRILGINIAPAFHAMLAARGDLELGADRFINAGPAIERKVTLLGFGVRLNIASALSGRLMRYRNSFQLAFEPDHSVCASKFMFRVQLRHLDLNADRVFVDFAGAQDVFIELERQNKP